MHHDGERVRVRALPPRNMVRGVEGERCDRRVRAFPGSPIELDDLFAGLPLARRQIAAVGVLSPAQGFGRWAVGDVAEVWAATLAPCLARPSGLVPVTVRGGGRRIRTGHRGREPLAQSAACPSRGSARSSTVMIRKCLPRFGARCSAIRSCFPGLAFLRVPGRKTVKNRLHLDLNPSDQQAEVQRLLDLGRPGSTSVNATVSGC